MNILIFSHSSTLGGAERSMLGLIDSLKKHFKISVIIPCKGLLETELKKRNISYKIINYNWWTSVGKPDPKIFAESHNDVLESLDIVSGLKPDLIISNTSVIPWGAVCANQLGVPHIWNIREFIVKDHNLNPIIPFSEIAQYIYNNSDKIWFVSEAVKNEFEKHIPNDKSTVIYTKITLDSKKIDSKIDNPYKFEDSYKLIIAGGIAKNKGQIEALEATKLLIDKGINVELLILGVSDKNNSYYKKLRGLISEKYAKRIQLKKFAENPYPYIKKADTLLLCSKMEAFSRTIVEAGLIGKTVISTDTGGSLEIINHNINGLLYKSGVPSDLASKIEYLINNPIKNQNMAKELNLLAKNKFEKNSIINTVLPKQIKKLPFASRLIELPKLISTSLKELRKTNSSPVQNDERQAKIAELENQLKDTANLIILENHNLLQQNNDLKSQIYKYESMLNQIYYSKFYKLWQKFNDFKKQLL